MVSPTIIDKSAFAELYLVVEPCPFLEDEVGQNLYDPMFPVAFEPTVSPKKGVMWNSKDRLLVTV
jgi:hypothetical protein